MTELIDNPPPLPNTASLAMSGRSTEYVDGYEDGFDSGVAARQPEIDALRARIRAMEEQEPAAWAMLNKDGEVYDCIGLEEHDSHEGSYTTPLYTAPGAKNE